MYYLLHWEEGTTSIVDGRAIVEPSGPEVNTSIKIKLKITLQLNFGQIRSHLGRTLAELRTNCTNFNFEWKCHFNTYRR